MVFNQSILVGRYNIKTKVKRLKNLETYLEELEGGNLKFTSQMKQSKSLGTESFFFTLDRTNLLYYEYSFK